MLVRGVFLVIFVVDSESVGMPLRHTGVSRDYNAKFPSTQIRKNSFEDDSTACMACRSRSCTVNREGTM
jgi:hypothetical protein